VVAGPWDLVPRQLDGSDHWLTPGASDFEAWLSVAYAERLDQYEAAGARVAWTTAPCSEERLAASPLFESVATTRAALDVQHRVLDELAAARPDVLTVVDLDAEICPGGEYTSRIGPHPEGRPDGLHFSVEAAESLGDWLIPRVTGITD